MRRAPRADARAGAWGGAGGLAAGAARPGPKARPGNLDYFIEIVAISRSAAARAATMRPATAEDAVLTNSICEGMGRAVSLMPQTVLGGGMRELASVCTMCNDAEIGYADGAFTRVGECSTALSAPQ